MLKFLSSLVICFALCFNSNAQSLKVYSGKYKQGKATYSYKDNPEGGRIFEGNFTYTCLGIGGNVIGSATGKFKNNQKNGLWTYVQNGTTTLKVSYKDGVLDGIYQYSMHSTGRTPKTLSLTIEKGKFVGSAMGSNILFRWTVDGRLTQLIMVDFDGQFDENGCFHDKWTFRDMDREDVMYHAIYEHGICKKYYCEDLTTGDIEKGKGDISLALNQIISDNNDELERMVDRNNKRWEWNRVAENDYQNQVITESKQNPCEGEVFEVVEQQPEFPGGMGELMTFISKNLRYPEEVKMNGIQGRVTVEFVVNKDGSISDAKVIRGIDPSLDKEAVRIIQTMPKWKPGKQCGEAVRVKFTIPVMFRL